MRVSNIGHTNCLNFNGKLNPEFVVRPQRTTERSVVRWRKRQKRADDITRDFQFIPAKQGEILCTDRLHPNHHIYSVLRCTAGFKIVSSIRLYLCAILKTLTDKI